MVKKSLIIWTFLLIVLLNAQSTLLGGQEFELTKQKAKEYMAGYDKSVELIDKTMSGSSDSTMDIIMLV